MTAVRHGCPLQHENRETYSWMLEFVADAIGCFFIFCFFVFALMICVAEETLYRILDAEGIIGKRTTRARADAPNDSEGKSRR